MNSFFFKKTTNIVIMIASYSTTGNRTPGLPFKKYIGPLMAFCYLASLLSCSAPNTEKKYRIGFSQCTGADNWRKATLEGMKRELSFHPGAELIYKNAQDNSDLQVSQIKDLVSQNIDILLVSPNEAQPLTSVIEEAFNKGIPVVIIDRKTSSNLYTSFVGVNNFEIGKMAGNYVANLAKGPTNVIEIIGLKGSTPSSDRQRGFAEGIRTNPDVHNSFLIKSSKQPS
jgi:ABC-type sugar transport system substrate-binding protein